MIVLLRGNSAISIPSSLVFSLCPRIGDFLHNGDERQYDCRGVLHIMINPLLSYLHLGCHPEWRSCIQISVIFWESAGRNFQADAMPDLEDLRGIPAVDVVLVYLPWFDQRGPVQAISE